MARRCVFISRMGYNVKALQQKPLLFRNFVANFTYALAVPAPLKVSKSCQEFMVRLQGRSLVRLQKSRLRDNNTNNAVSSQSGTHKQQPTPLWIYVTDVSTTTQKHGLLRQHRFQLMGAIGGIDRRKDEKTNSRIDEFTNRRIRVTVVLLMAR